MAGNEGKTYEGYIKDNYEGSYEDPGHHSLWSADQKPLHDDHKEHTLYIIGDCGDPGSVLYTIESLRKHISEDKSGQIYHVIFNGDFIYPGIDTTKKGCCAKNIIHNDKAFREYFAPFIELKNLVQDSGGDVTFSLGNHERGNGTRWELRNLCGMKRYSRVRDRMQSDSNARAFFNKLPEELRFPLLRQSAVDLESITAERGSIGDEKRYNGESYHHIINVGETKIFIADSTVMEDQEQQYDLTQFLLERKEAGDEAIIVSHHPCQTPFLSKTKDEKEKSYPHDTQEINHNQLTEQIISECQARAGKIDDVIVIGAHVHKHASFTTSQKTALGQIVKHVCHLNGAGAIGESKVEDNGYKVAECLVIKLVHDKKVSIEHKKLVAESFFSKHNYKILIFPLLLAIATGVTTLNTDLLDAVLKQVTDLLGKPITSSLAGLLIYVLSNIIACLCGICSGHCKVRFDYAEVNVPMKRIPISNEPHSSYGSFSLLRRNNYHPICSSEDASDKGGVLRVD